MKYLIVLADGAADRKLDVLNGKTPLQVAKIDTINALAKKGEIGLVNVTPEGMSPGSDVANLSVMGYDPSVYHTGRSPLEAVSMGIDMDATDVAYRCNLVTLEGDGIYEEKTIIDHSSGDISNEEAKILIEAMEDHFGSDTLKFYPGVSYRHALIMKNGSVDSDLTPPHDILTRKIDAYLPKGDYADIIDDMMKKSYDILENHPVNIARKEKGLNPGNSIWIWGQGKKPKLDSFYDKYNVTGATVSAVDLIKGIGLCAGLESIEVEGATGTINTNYQGKVDATIDAFNRGLDFVYLHIEAPDECSHQGNLDEKIEAIELIDTKVVKPLLAYLESTGEDFKLMVLPDHPTPIELRTHSSEPVPFMLYDSRKEYSNSENSFDEQAAVQSGCLFEQGYKLTDYYFTS